MKLLIAYKNRKYRLPQRSEYFKDIDDILDEFHEESRFDVTTVGIDREIEKHLRKFLIRAFERKIESMGEDDLWQEWNKQRLSWKKTSSPFLNPVA